MSKQKFNTTINYSDFFALDFRKLPTEVLKTIRLKILSELKKRETSLSCDKTSIVTAFAGLPIPSQQINNKASEYLAHLLSQDWSEFFPNGDLEPKYYVYAHVKPSASKLKIEERSLSLKFQGFPFYIGKGCGNRAHDLKRNQGHGALIKELIDSNIQSSEIVHFVKQGLTESKALELESKLIYFFGTRYEPDRRGLLVNLDIPKRPNFISWRKWVEINKGIVHPA
jgi:hypothetical protein